MWDGGQLVESFRKHFDMTLIFLLSLSPNGSPRASPAGEKKNWLAASRPYIITGIFRGEEDNTLFFAFILYAATLPASVASVLSSFSLL